MKLRIFQKGFNYSQDGQGNRLVIHLQGCNLHCPWCSNPEGMQVSEILGEEISVPNLFKEIVSCKRMFFDGGGVTFTGGECTLQFKGLRQVLALCKQNDINTAIETNGTCQNIQQLLPYLDLVICDYKHYDQDKLQKIIGVKNQYTNQIVELINSKVPLWIRTVLIHNFNDSEQDAYNFLKVFSNLDCSHVKFEFLAYHEYGKCKWEKIGKPYTIQDGFITQSKLDFFENLFSSHNLNIIRS